MNRLLFYGIATLGTAAMVLQVFNFLRWNRFWPFFTITVVQLIAAMVQFLRMVLIPPRTTVG